MSLEAKIEALTHAVMALTAKLEAVPATTPVPAPMENRVVIEAPVAQAVVESPTVTAQSEVVTPASTMPEPPAFAPVAPVATGGAPFSDTKGLIDYAMSAYKVLGPQKGAQIQGALTSLGYQNINDVKPEHYPALYQAIETLKGA